MSSTPKTSMSVMRAARRAVSVVIGGSFRCAFVVGTTVTPWVQCRQLDLVPIFCANSHDPRRARHAQPDSGLPTVGGTGPAKVSRHHQALSDSARTDTRPAERDR